MKRDLQGKYVIISTIGEVAKAFIPSPLPPNPPIEWSPELRSKFDEALLALGRLDSMSILLPDTAIFIYMYIRKEAVLSSMIEGTQSSISNLMLFELDQEPGVPLDDVKEVSNYIAALTYGLNQLEKGFPLSLRLLKEIHEVLLSGGRGSNLSPGEFRRSQNWIGGTRPGNAAFVPPTVTELLDCMNQLELFLHNIPEFTPALVKAALAHVQFETIHPFLDGNGRLGRLLITLLLCEQNILSEPLLYLSLYFKTHRSYYYELLNNVRLYGEWEAWLDFFADAVIHTASQALETAKKLMALSNRDIDLIRSLGKSSASAKTIHKALFERPIATAQWLTKKTGLSAATTYTALKNLSNLGVVVELTDQKRNRVFSYREYISIINNGINTV
jgi:cell filamentation protein, protein adenylyltransferase